MNKKNHHPIYHLDKKYDSIILFKPPSTQSIENSH